MSAAARRAADETRPELYTRDARARRRVSTLAGAVVIAPGVLAFRPMDSWSVWRVEGDYAVCLETGIGSLEECKAGIV